MNMNSTKAEKIIAAFEAFKGLIVLFAGFGFIKLVHRDARAFIEKLIDHMHLNPSGHYHHIFLNLAAHVTNTKLWLLALFAFLYAIVRLAEAYGLWKGMRWAKWLAATSGAIYLPIEAYHSITAFSWLTCGLMIINFIVVIYMLKRVKA